MKERLLAQLAELKKTKPKLARQFENQVETMLARLAAGDEPARVEPRLEALGGLLGIRPARVCCGFNEIEAGHVEIAGLVLLPEARAARRKAQREAQARRRALRWDAQREAGELTWAYELPRRRGRDPVLRALGFGPDGRFWLVEAEDAQSPASLVALDERGLEVARHGHDAPMFTSLSPDGRRLGSVAAPRRPVVLRRTSDLAVVLELPPTRGLGHVFLAHRGPYVAVHDLDGALSFYREDSGELVKRADIRGANVTACGWSTDGRRFVRIEGGEVVVSRVPEGGDILVRPTRHGVRAFSACVLPESERLLIAGDGGAVVMTLEGEAERRLHWSVVGPERAEAFDRMAQLLSVGATKTTGSELAKAQPQLAQSGRAVAAAPGWWAVLGAEGIVRLWSATSGEPIGRRDTQQALQWEMFASASGDRLVTGGNPVLCWLVR
jgi:hypothetical protein